MPEQAFPDPITAIKLEKSIKGWPRRWKLALIARDNPHWVDKWDEINGIALTGPHAQALGSPRVVIYDTFPQSHKPS